MSNNPYSSLPDWHFWRRSVATTEKFAVDPLIQAKFKITPTDKVATAGSCFAQHLSRALQAEGYNYYVTESGEGLSDSEKTRRNYGVYSARYGNIYTLRQLLQLLAEAFDGAVPSEQVWSNSDATFLDPYRPGIEPDGFDSKAAVSASRQDMLEAFRTMILTSDVFVFTLGLTECWRNKDDGWVYPIVPGALGGTFDADRYEFTNFGFDDTRQDLAASLNRIKELNPDIRIVLTVSPVPLIATFEERHVLMSTTYSKSVLRAAAGEFTDANDWVDYFPSYEIIVGNYNSGTYFEADFREVRPEGVAHVMRVVRTKLLEGGKSTTPETTQNAGSLGWLSGTNELVCDEEALDEIRPLSHSPLFGQD